MFSDGDQPCEPGHGIWMFLEIRFAAKKVEFVE
jgi:hypothetical protein